MHILWHLFIVTELQSWEIHIQNMQYAEYAEKICIICQICKICKLKRNMLSLAYPQRVGLVLQNENMHHLIKYVKYAEYGLTLYLHNLGL
jgi:hypothetical protein